VAAYKPAPALNNAIVPSSRKPRDGGRAALHKKPAPRVRKN
jgi:hypothetical protein